MQPNQLKPLSALDIIRVWEWGKDKAPLDKALALLGAALPHLKQEELQALPIGRRDALLLSLREKMLGSKLPMLTHCPKCKEKLEFAVEAKELLLESFSQEVQPSYELSRDGVTATFRLPNSLDLAQAVHQKDIAAAKATLLHRCLISVQKEKEPARVSPELLEAISEKILECDPQAEVQFGVVCPACQNGWSVIFEVTSYFWTELNAQVKRLLQEVGALAKIYGWSEAEILSLSAQRRKMYLDMLR